MDAGSVIKLAVFDDNCVAIGVGSSMVEEIYSVESLVVHLKITEPAAVYVHADICTLRGHFMETNIKGNCGTTRIGSDVNVCSVALSLAIVLASKKFDLSVRAFNGDVVATAHGAVHSEFSKLVPFI